MLDGPATVVVVSGDGGKMCVKPTNGDAQQCAMTIPGEPVPQVGATVQAVIRIVPLGDGSATVIHVRQM